MAKKRVPEAMGENEAPTVNDIRPRRGKPAKRSRGKDGKANTVHETRGLESMLWDLYADLGTWARVAEHAGYSNAGNARRAAYRGSKIQDAATREKALQALELSIDECTERARQEMASDGGKPHERAKAWLEIGTKPALAKARILGIEAPREVEAGKNLGSAIMAALSPKLPEGDGDG